MLLCLLLCFPKEHKQKLILLFLRLFLLALVEHISSTEHLPQHKMITSREQAAKCLVKSSPTSQF